MSYRVYPSVQALLNDLCAEHLAIHEELRKLFLAYPGVTESVKRDCLHFNFPNGMRVYINTRKQKYPIIGVSRGARMVRQNPVFFSLFDEVLKVVGKIYLTDISVIEKKGIKALVKYIAELPKGIGVL